jgi:hypothetical protein
MTELGDEMSTFSRAVFSCFSPSVSGTHWALFGATAVAMVTMKDCQGRLKVWLDSCYQGFWAAQQD